MCVCVCVRDLNITLITSNFPVHNTFHMSDIHISTKSVAHYKKQTPTSGSNSGSEFRAFCDRRNSVIPQRTIRCNTLIIPYLLVDFNCARHLY